MNRRPPRSTLFPTTPLFRSRRDTPPASVAVEAGSFGLAAVRAQAGFAKGRVRQSLDVAADRSSGLDRKSTRLNSSHANISYAVFCLKKKKQNLGVSSFPILP